MRTSSFVTRSVLALLAVSAAACSSAPEEAPPLGGAVPPGSVGVPSGPSAAPSDPGAPVLPPAPPPSEESLVEAKGIFVAKHGAADAPGTRKSPLASIADAIAAAKTAKKANVFVCEGTYEEAIVVESGISIVGGLDCAGDTWKLSDKTSTLKSPSSPAVRATAIVAPTRIDHLAIVAPDAEGASASSIGVVVVDSNGLLFAKGSIVAGNATAGEDGVEPEQLFLQVDEAPGAAAAARTAGNGAGSTHTPGGNGAVASCVDSARLGVVQSGGGRGGTSGVYYRYTTASTWSASSAPVAPDMVPTGGASGANGASGEVGSIGADGFAPSHGTAGTSGAVGTGGRGGAGAQPPSTESGWWLGRSGPGGGAGGCPGLAGTAGRGGGASLGVVAIASPVRFEDMTITTGTGGAGGKGTLGTDPTNGSAGADDGGGIVLIATKSSPGGRGGASGYSGHGAGGPSIGIAYHGAEPLVARTTTTPGAGGAGVEARSGNGKTIPAAPAGASEGKKAM